MSEAREQYPSDYADALAPAPLRYAADHTTLQTLLEAVRNRDPIQKAVTADALSEHGREAEAEFLRSGHPVFIHNGQVFPATGELAQKYAHPFLRSALETALWSETDNDGNPLDQNHTVRDYEPDTVGWIYDTAADFLRDHGHLIGEAMESEAGHNWWLTRNGHGAGFRDSPEVWGYDAGRKLTEGARRQGGMTLNAFDGKVHGLPF